MKAFLSLVVCVLLLGAGCGRQTDSSESGPRTPPPPEMPAQDELAKMSPAERQAVIERVRREQDTAAQANSAMLTFALQEFMARHNRAPAELNELVTTKFVPEIPPLPSGMSYQINAPARQVVVVRK